MLLSTLVLVTLAAAHWHSARGHAQQAHAPRQTAEHLRTAYRQAATTPMRTLHDQGRALPDAQRRTYETTIRAALPNHGVQADGVPATTDALAATLAQAEQAGHDPEALLRQAIDMRELDTATDVNDVLVWRLRRIAQLPAHPGAAPRRPKDGTSNPKASANRTSNRTTPATGVRPVASTPRNRPRHHPHRRMSVTCSSGPSFGGRGFPMCVGRAHHDRLSRSCFPGCRPARLGGRDRRCPVSRLRHRLRELGRPGSRGR